ncbi:MAG: hypothetical protein E7258_09885 [Lachnospiraceae bacterium]|nr:hypothetical protein [Lachnospiraceae bacterium]
MNTCNYCGGAINQFGVCSNCGTPAPQQMYQQPQQVYQQPQQMYQQPQQAYQQPQQVYQQPQQVYQQPQQVYQQPQQAYQQPQSQAAGGKKFPLIPVIMLSIAVIALIVVLVLIMKDKDGNGSDKKQSSQTNTAYHKEEDVASAKIIKTAVETSLGNENFYNLVTANGPTVITIYPGQEHSDISGITYDTASYFMAIDGGATSNNYTNYNNDKDANTVRDEWCQELALNMGDSTPDIEYGYDVLTGEETDLVYYVYVSEKATVYVLIGHKDLSDELLNMDTSVIPDANGQDGLYSITPELCDSYK